MKPTMPLGVPDASARPKRSVFALGAVLSAIGFGTFIAGAASEHPAYAWQAYLINFLLWSAIAQGAVLFSAVTHITKARWSGPLDGLSGAFAGFFPLSFGLFLLLFLGKAHVFPWMHEDLHGKEIWLNIPFLFARDAAGLLILYGVGFAFLADALKLRLNPTLATTGLRRFVRCASLREGIEVDRIKRRMSLWAGLYIFAFAFVLSLIGFDLVMSMDPHWVSTLFGAYHFVKAFYLGLGGLIILAAIVCRQPGKKGRAGAKSFSRHRQTLSRILPGVGGFFLCPTRGDLVRQPPGGDTLCDFAHHAAALAAAGVDGVFYVLHNPLPRPHQ